MQNGEHSRIYSEYRDKIRDHKRIIAELERECNQKLSELEQQCLAQHSTHNDNGGFMFGTCTRCGANL